MESNPTKFYSILIKNILEEPQLISLFGDNVDDVKLFNCAPEEAMPDYAALKEAIKSLSGNVTVRLVDVNPNSANIKGCFPDFGGFFHNVKDETTTPPTETTSHIYAEINPYQFQGGILDCEVKDFGANSTLNFHLKGWNKIVAHIFPSQPIVAPVTTDEQKTESTETLTITPPVSTSTAEDPNVTEASDNATKTYIAANVEAAAANDAGSNISQTTQPSEAAAAETNPPAGLYTTAETTPTQSTTPAPETNAPTEPVLPVQENIVVETTSQPLATETNPLPTDSTPVEPTITTPTESTNPPTETSTPQVEASSTEETQPAAPTTPTV